MRATVEIPPLEDAGADWVFGFDSALVDGNVAPRQWGQFEDRRYGTSNMVHGSLRHAASMFADAAGSLHGTIVRLTDGHSREYYTVETHRQIFGQLFVEGPPQDLNQGTPQDLKQGTVLFAVLEVDLPGSPWNGREIAVPTHLLAMAATPSPAAAGDGEGGEGGEGGGGQAAEHALKFFPLWQHLPDGGRCAGCGQRRTRRYCAACLLCEVCTGGLAGGCGAAGLE